MEGQACPLLGSLSEQGVYLSYPNFENRCYASGRSEATPLSQQQFFCFGGQFHTCPRFLKQAGQPPLRPTPTTNAAFRAPTEIGREEISANDVPVLERATSRRPKWLPVALGAGGTLVAIVLCVVIFGSFVVWRLWTDRLASRPPTSVVADLAPLRPATFTPTPRANEPATVDPAVAAAFATVTAIAQLNGEGGLSPGFFLTPRPTPTRRPTPLDGTVVLFDTPTPTPLPIPIQFATSTPTSEFGSPTFTPRPTEPAVPIINFSAAPRTILQGQCATLRWSTAGIEAVYLDVDGQEAGVTGTGSRQVCPTLDTDYFLRVVLRDLTEQTWTATVLVRGTPTPSLTPSPTNTPFVTATPTPTDFPTATPTPTPFFGVRINGSNASVSLPADGAEHQVASLGVENTGTGTDQVGISLSGGVPSGWKLLLCLTGSSGERCFSDNSTEVTLAPNAVETAQIRLLAPAGTAPGTSTTISLEAASRNDSSKRASVQLIVVVP